MSNRFAPYSRIVFHWHSRLVSHSDHKKILEPPSPHPVAFSEPLVDQSAIQQENARHEQLVQLLRATQKHQMTVDSPPQKERNVFFSNLIKTIQNQRSSSDIIEYSSDSEQPNEPEHRERYQTRIPIKTRGQQTSPIKTKRREEPLFIKKEATHLSHQDASLLFQEDTSMLMPVTEVIQSMESSKCPSVRSYTPASVKSHRGNLLKPH